MSIFSPALIVEDDPLSAVRLQRLLGACMPGIVVQVAPSLADADALLARHPFRLALVDMHLPDGLGTGLIARMRVAQPDLQAVIVSSFGSEELVLRGVQAGAIGYLLKDADDADLLSALRSIERGGAPMDPVVARKILALAAGPHPRGAADQPGPDRTGRTPAPTPDATAGADGHVPVPALSRREHQVLELIAQGWTNREIADAIHLSTHTVESHAKSIYRKLAVGSRTQAVHQARRVGLLGE